MKKCNPLTACFILFLFLLVGKLYAAVEWKLVGLDTLSVNCLMVFRTNNPYCLAGTDRGFFFKGDNELQFRIFDALSGNGFALDKRGCLFAIAGNGSDSDGVFLGEDIIDGEPYWAFKRGPLIPFPQSLTTKYSLNDTTIFIGHQNNIRVLYNASQSIPLQKELILPQNCFGVELPKCAALQVFGNDGRLYAGGHDLSPEPGQGSLLFQMNDQSDTMLTLRRLNVTSLLELFTEFEGLKLYVGTQDSGIYSFTDPLATTPWNHIPSPNNEPVNDMIAIPAKPMVLCVAVNSGVFLGGNGKWRELGDLPKIPNCLALAPGSIGFTDCVLYAGTTEGIYFLDSLAVSIGHQSKKESYLDNRIMVKNQIGVVSVCCSLYKQGKVTLDLFTLTGKKVGIPVNRYFPAGRQVISWNTNTILGKGFGNSVYVLRLSIDGKQDCKRFVRLN